MPAEVTRSDLLEHFSSFAVEDVELVREKMSAFVTLKDKSGDYASMVVDATNKRSLKAHMLSVSRARKDAMRRHA